jgi:hypothetical protein
MKRLDAQMPNRTVVWVSGIGFAALIYMGLVLLVALERIEFDEITDQTRQFITAALGILVPSPLFSNRAQEGADNAG